MSGTSDELDHPAVNLNAMFDSNQRLMDSLRQVSSSIAHDLRSPMSRLRQSLEEARICALTEADYRKAIDLAILDTDRILSTFSALLRIAHVGSGSRRGGFKRVYLSGIFEKVGDAYKAVAEDEGKSLIATVDSGISYTGDEDLLTQLVVNLVENAIKHTPKGTEINIPLRQASNGIFGEVSDNGQGIPEAERSKVFEHFYRLDHSRTTPGNGLGLSLAAVVADLHGISIMMGDRKPGLKVAMKF
ncbi:MAG: sensor histidine kinase [Parvibaculaceae bacterium]